MSTQEYDEIDFTCPESLSSYEERELFYLFVEAFNSLDYTKEDLIEHIQKNGFNTESLLNEIVFRYNNRGHYYYGISLDLIIAFRQFAEYVGLEKDYIDGFELNDVDEDDLIKDVFYWASLGRDVGEDKEEDKEYFLREVLDKSRLIDNLAAHWFGEFLGCYPELIGLEKDEDEDHSEHIAEWYSNVADQKLVPILTEIKKQFEQHQQKKAEFILALKQALLSNQTIEELLEEGYIGVNYELADDFAFAAAAHKFKDKIKWTKTQPDEDSDVALMTPNLAEFDELLDFMLDKFGWCPKVYSNEESPEIFIFTPQNDFEKGVLSLTTDGDYGWKGSLYSLDYFATAENQNILGLIFATKPKDTQEQEWLLVQIDRQKNSRSWSVHPGTLEQVYYIWAEKIGIPEPNFKPTYNEILDVLE